MKIGFFDPGERAREKQASREEDDRLLAAGQISVAELSERNSMFAGLDLAHSSVILPANRY
jgi:hypothetical protein